MSDFWIFLIVVACLGFVYLVIKMGLRHAENMKRIERGYLPPDDADLSETESRSAERLEKRLQ